MQTLKQFYSLFSTVLNSQFISNATMSYNIIDKVNFITGSSSAAVNSYGLCG